MPFARCAPNLTCQHDHLPRSQMIFHSIRTGRRTDPYSGIHVASRSGLPNWGRPESSRRIGSR